MWLSLIVPSAYATIGFVNSWNKTTEGKCKIEYSYNQQSFQAFLKEDPNQLIELDIVDNKLKISALPPRIWCLLFNEGQLIYPSPFQQGHEASIEVDDRMEVVVALFNNTPRTLIRRLGIVDRPMTMEEFTTLSELWSRFRLFKGGFTVNPTPFRSPIRVRYCGEIIICSTFLFLVFFLVGGVLLGRHFFDLSNQAPSLPSSSTRTKWIDVFCKLADGGHYEFSNLYLQGTNQWRQELVKHCVNVNSSIIRCYFNYFSFPYSEDCGFTGND